MSVRASSSSSEYLDDARANDEVADLSAQKVDSSISQIFGKMGLGTPVAQTPFTPQTPYTETDTQPAGSPDLGRSAFSPAPIMGPLTPEQGFQATRQIGRAAASDSISPQTLQETADKVSNVYLERFSPQETQNAVAYFNSYYPKLVRLCGGKISAKEAVLPLIGRKTTEKRILFFKAPPIGSGGFAKAYFGMMRGKQGKLKYVAVLHNEKPREENPVERVLSELPKHLRPTQKMWLTKNPQVSVQPLAANGDLLDFMASNPGIDRLFYVQQVLECYDQFHRRGYAHRDLKAMNFLVDEKETIRLSDLDTAVEYRGQSEKLRQGTILYWPPNFENVDLFAADCYALGLTILDMYDPKLLDHVGQGCIAYPFLEANREYVESLFPQEIRPFILKCIYNHNAVTDADFDEVLRFFHQGTSEWV